MGPLPLKYGSEKLRDSRRSFVIITEEAPKLHFPVVTLLNIPATAESTIFNP